MDIGNKSISPVVAIALLLIVAVVAVISFNTWVNGYLSSTFSDTEIKSNDALTGGVGIENIIGGTLYIKSNVDNLSVTTIKIDNVDCSIAQTVNKGITEFDVSTCLESVTTTTPYVVLITDKQVVQKKIYLKDYSVVNALNGTEIGFFTSSDIQSMDFFGSSVATYGDYIVVGADREDGGLGDPTSNAGAAYVYKKNISGGFDEVAILHPSDIQANDYFAEVISIYGDYIVIGASGEDGGLGDPALDAGAAYVYKKNISGGFDEVAILHASDMQANDYFGGSVSISGDYIVVGAPGEDGGAGDPVSNAGATYVYKKNASGGFDEVVILHASDMQSIDRFGISVSISSDYIVVGADGEDGGAGDPVNYAGATYVYKKNASDGFDEVAILHASDMQANDYFGGSVSISGNYIVVGAEWEDGGAGNPTIEGGAAYVYKRNSSDGFDEVAILHASNKGSNDNFGGAVAISGDYVVVGADMEDGGVGNPVEDAGAAYLYKKNSTGGFDEIQMIHASDMTTYNQFGDSVAASQNYIVVGNSWGDVGGKVYVFE